MSDNSLKHCNKCGEDKTRDNFYKDKSKKDGLNTVCKPCVNVRQFEYKKKHEDWYRKERKRHYWKDRDSAIEAAKRWREDNLDYRKEYQRQYYEENKEHMYSVSKEWERRNIDYVRKYRREKERERRKNDIKYNISCRMRQFVRRVLNGTPKSSSSEDLLGYSNIDLITRLEFNFKPGMAWENYGSVWNIDHVIPIDYFLSKGEERPHIINALSNLKPVWASDNFSKGPKYIPINLREKNGS